MTDADRKGVSASYSLSPRPSRSRGEALASAHACALAYAMEAGAPRAPARRRQPHEPPTSAETRRAHLLALYINRALNPVLHFTIKQLLVEDGVRGPFVPVAAHVTPQKTSAPAPSYALEFPGRWDRCFRRLWLRDDHSNAG